jgi:zinc transport system substrate-binding protein
LVLVVSCGTVLASGCVPSDEDSDRLVVAVTLLPQAAFVEAVAGERAEVVVMVPPGASPHTYEVTPDQMVSLARARMYAKVGAPVEFELTWMDRLVEANREMLVVDCARGIELMASNDEGHDGMEDEGYEANEGNSAGVDPHIWVSLRNAQAMVQNICDGLVQVDPPNADVYRANCDSYVAELSALDVEVMETFESVDQRRFIVFHPSFGYFARDYDLTQIAVEQGGSEPDAQYLVRLIDEAKEFGIQVVLAEPQFSTRSAEVVASEIGGEVVIVDPLSRDYIPNMRAIADAIQQVTQRP